MPWTLQSALARYRQAVTGDLGPQQYAARVTVCAACPHRRGRTCGLSALPIPGLAGRASSICRDGRWLAACTPPSSAEPSPTPPTVRVPPSRLDQVTVAITAFRRPRCLERLIASIRQHYPSLPVIVADNGDMPATIAVPGVEYHTLPFDCGVSAARNWLCDRVRTPYLLLCEEDFVFTAETRLEAFLDVLGQNPEVGLVGGRLRYPESGAVQDWSTDLTTFRDTLTVNLSRGPWRATPAGTPYQLCDMTFNWFLARRELLADHRWDERLKVGEHLEFFLRVQQARRWRVAYTPHVTCDHDRHSERGPDYQSHRRRARDLGQQAVEFHGLRRAVVAEAARIDGRERTAIRPPNAVILGAGHSGTSLLTGLLHATGWQAGDADHDYGESVSVRAVNQAALRGSFDVATARAALDALPQPWAVKDPRFVQTLHRWLAVFAESEPTLLLIERDPAALAESYARGDWVRRQREGSAPPDRPREATLAAEQALARQQFDRWPWGKISVRYEDIVAAAATVRGQSAARPPASVSEIPSETQHVPLALYPNRDIIWLSGERNARGSGA